MKRKLLVILFFVVLIFGQAGESKAGVSLIIHSEDLLESEIFGEFVAAYGTAMKLFLDKFGRPVFNYRIEVALMLYAYSDKEGAGLQSGIGIYVNNDKLPFLFVTLGGDLVIDDKTKRKERIYNLVVELAAATYQKMRRQEGSVLRQTEVPI